MKETSVRSHRATKSRVVHRTGQTQIRIDAFTHPLWVQNPHSVRGQPGDRTELPGFKVTPPCAVTVPPAYIALELADVEAISG